MTGLPPLLLLALASLQVADALDGPRLPPAGELRGDLAGARPATWRSALLGRVLDVDGRPAEGALVVSSAGGRAVCDAHGEYLLALELPWGARELRVTAALGSGAGRRVASAAVVLDAPAPSHDVAPLELAAGGPCQPDWLPTFGGFAGTEHIVFDLAVFDHGGGPDLYVAGGFQTAGGKEAMRIARWDGQSWSSLGIHFNDFVRALAVYDDGSGPKLYMGGDFTTLNGFPVGHIVGWDGSTWSMLGSGVQGGVYALEVFDGGTGPYLYVGGAFTTAGGVYSPGLARWTPGGWLPTGSGVNGRVYALAAHTQGAWPWLVVGGDFTSAGGLPVNRVARWIEGAWSPLGSGMNDDVLALCSFDAGDGAGAKLYAGGRFTLASGVPLTGVVVWSPATSTWVHPPNMTDNGGSVVHALAARSGPGGSELLVGSSQSDFLGGELLRWNGNTVLQPKVHLSGYPQALLAHDDGSGERIFVGGYFLSASVDGGVPVGAACALAFDGAQIEPLGDGLDNEVVAMTVHDDGGPGGPALYAAGPFLNPGNGIARWDDGAWSSLPIGVLAGGIRCMLSHDDGTSGGPALYVGGALPAFVGVSSDNIARFSGGAWSGLGSGLNDEVLALAAWDDQTLGGPAALFAGGLFTSADGLPASRLARWDGGAWSAVGGGANGAVRALAVYDDGSGPSLFAAGGFTQVGGSVAANRIARWDGSTWSPLGGGMDAEVNVLAVHDDGSGPQLYAGGRFATAGGVTVNGIARWNGSVWKPLGSGLQEVGVQQVLALQVFDDATGGGPALYAGGTIFGVGGVSAWGVARWDGAAWSPLGAGVQGPFVNALAAFDDGSGNALYVGGGFLSTSSGDSMLARWGGCGGGPGACTPTLVGPYQVTLDGCGTLTTDFEITSDGALGPGTWTLDLDPTFPVWNGMSLAISSQTATTVTLDWDATSPSAPGLWLNLLTWTGTCNGQPVQWSNYIVFELTQPCAPPPPVTAYCFGDGSGAACPCGNYGQAGAGCRNSTGQGALLAHLGSASVSAHDLVLRTTSAVPGKVCVYYQGTAQTGGGPGIAFSDGLLCIGGTLKKLQSVGADAQGSSSTTVGIAAKGGVLPGDTRYYQAWYREIPSQSPCGNKENRTNALAVTWFP